MEPPVPPRIIRFGVFQVDLCSGELFKNGHKVRIEAQPFHILSILLKRPGELVTREELKQGLWNQDTFVDFDHGLNAAIKKLREALNDEAKTPHCIETLPRRGYRFICPLDRFPEATQPRGRAPPKVPRAKESKSRDWLLWIGVLVVLMLSVLILVEILR
jgi:DNA-binding winged helix-turn-helix (wHTH) protein